MNKLKISLSMIVMLLVSGGAAYAVVQSLNSLGSGDQTLLSDFSNISIVSSSSANSHTLKWNGVLPVSKGGTGMSSFTNGSILFYSSGASISQDNSNLFWNNTTKRLAVGANTPSSEVNVNGTVEATQVSTNTIVASGSNQSLSLTPTGTGKVLVGGESLVVARLTSQPASASTGQIYFDRNTNQFKGYDGTNWVNLNPTGLNNGLVSYWKFDESSGNASDSYGVNDLTNINSVTYSTGKINNAAYLTRASSMKLTNASQTGLPTGAGARTINMWVYISATGTQYGAFFYGTASVQDMMAIYIDSANNLLQVNGHTADYNPAFTWSANTWYMVTAVYTGTEIHAYVNGTELGTGLAQTWTTASGTVVDIGQAEGSYFGGRIDEVGAWSRALSGSEITSLYNGGSGLPLSEF